MQRFEISEQLPPTDPPRMELANTRQVSDLAALSSHL